MGYRISSAGYFSSYNNFDFNGLIAFPAYAEEPNI
jgi:hypothetical protein